MLRWIVLGVALLGMGCGNEVRTYRLAPYLAPGVSCLMCGVSLTLRAQEEGADRQQYFAPEQLADEGFTFQWGVEQRVDIEVEQRESRIEVDDPGVYFIFQRVVERTPVDTSAHFEMPFPKYPPGLYSENFLVREGDGFRLGGTVHLACVSTEVCDALEARRLGEEAFALELAYPKPGSETLTLYAVKLTP